jgi:hypothetical protein
MFVDIDTLTTGEDYLLDYGLLLEDLLVYQALPYGDEPGQLTWDDIETRRPDSTDTTLENWIRYPAFPGRSEAALIFQRELLEQLQRYTTTIDDPHWQKRLWLAIARGLLLLAGRQLLSHTVEPRRRPNVSKVVQDLKLVQVTYAEALRLLHELHEHLESKETTPLPVAPFPGAHRPPPARFTSSSDSEIGPLLEAITRELGEAVGRQAVPDAPYLLDFATRPHQRVFARLHIKHKASALYLPYPAEQLDDPHQLLQPLTDSPWLTRLPLTPALSVSAVMVVLKQAFHLAAGGPIQ